jgi:hypothetical protein
MEDIGWRTDTGGTALLSFLYHMSKTEPSTFIAVNSSLSMASSADTMYVGIGLYPYFWPKKHYIPKLYFISFL